MEYQWVVFIALLMPAKWWRICLDKDVSTENIIKCVKKFVVCDKKWQRVVKKSNISDMIIMLHHCYIKTSTKVCWLLQGLWKVVIEFHWLYSMHHWCSASLMSSHSLLSSTKDTRPPHFLTIVSRNHRTVSKEAVESKVSSMNSYIKWV